MPTAVQIQNSKAICVQVVTHICVSCLRQNSAVLHAAGPLDKDTRVLVENADCSDTSRPTHSVSLGWHVGICL